MTVTASGLCLGKKEASYDKRDALWADFRASLAVAGLLPKIPIPFGSGLDFLGEAWGMFGNGPDNSVFPGFGGCGDCAWAGPAHEHMLLAKNLNHPVPVFNGKIVVGEYSAYCGFVPTSGANDNGSNLHEVAQWRATKGIKDATGGTHKIGMYLFGEPKNITELLEMAYFMQAAGIGIEFPESADDQFGEGKIWTPVSGAQIVGGHYIPVVGSAQAGQVTFITWAKRTLMSYAFYNKYNDEIYGYVTPEAISSVTGKDFHGFDPAHLEEYLHLSAKAKLNA